ncbi:MAG: hypothetical protein JO073_13300 [Actinobacteria bacterium]|nr:hypothetical protein [Actinomycetota bacterium]
MQTVVARFHHLSRDLEEIEDELRANGAPDAQITGYVVAMTFDTDSHKKAAADARRALDGMGATRIKIIKRHGDVTAPV